MVATAAIETLLCTQRLPVGLGYAQAQTQPLHGQVLRTQHRPRPGRAERELCARVLAGGSPGDRWRAQFPADSVDNPARTDPAMTSGARPDFGDRTHLIAQAHTHDVMQSPAGPGKLRTYLGIAPGVGKTYAMLRDARARRRSGTEHRRCPLGAARAPGDRCSARRPRSAPCPYGHLPERQLSRTSPSCGNSRSSGSMNPFPIRSRRSPPPTTSAGRRRPWSSLSVWRGHPPTNGSSVTPPISPGSPMPGSKRCMSRRSTISTGRRGRGWRRTAGCSANWAGHCVWSGPTILLPV